MGKPWARIEQNYINHPKFLALTAGAICLWHEGKNYCDMHMTDGLIPRAALKTFRFTGRASIELLIASCGEKASGDGAYAPLWEVHPLGFKMHDYLEHNDCREQVLKRIEKADDAREKDNERKAAARAAKKAIAEDRVREMSDRTNAGQNADCPRTVQEMSGSIQKQKQKQKQKQADPSDLQKSGVSKRPIYTSDRFAVFEWQLDELSKVLGSHFEDFNLHEFFDDLTQQSLTNGLVIPKDELWKWLQSQVLSEARRRGLPMATAEPQAPTNKRIAGLVAGGQAFLNRDLR